jgi:hypothetical protein
MPVLEGLERAQRPRHLPNVLSRHDVLALLDRLERRELPRPLMPAERVRSSRDRPYPVRLVPRRKSSDGLGAVAHVGRRRIGNASGATSNSMERATPG